VSVQGCGCARAKKTCVCARVRVCNCACAVAVRVSGYAHGAVRMLRYALHAVACCWRGTTSCGAVCSTDVVRSLAEGADCLETSWREVVSACAHCACRVRVHVCRR
jgi:hypothetical protein